MLRQIILVAMAGLMLGGCQRLAGTALNPGNWFRSAGGNVPYSGPLVPPEALVPPVDARVAVTVQTVEVARTESGALVTATGLAPAPGFYNAQLVRVGIDGGILILRFVAEAPPVPTSGGRGITAATTVSNATLAGLRGMRVEGAGGAVSAGF
jgi:hypothetical protein